MPQRLSKNVLTNGYYIKDPPPTHKKDLQQVAESGTNALNVDHISQQSQEFDKKQRIVKKKKKKKRTTFYIEKNQESCIFP